MKLASSIALLALVGCVQAPVHTEQKSVTDEFLINEALAGFAVEVGAGRTGEVLARLEPDFRLQGDGPAEVEEWSRSWLTYQGQLRVTVDQVAIDLAGASDPAKVAPEGAVATVAYSLSIITCPTIDAGVPNCRVLLARRDFAGGDQGWMTRLVKRGGRWQAAGDGQPFGLKLTSRHEGSNYLLEVRLRDPQRIVTGATITGPGAAAVPLAASATGEWRLSSAVVIGTAGSPPPSPPIAYRLDAQLKGGQRATEASVRGVVDELAVVTAPAGEVAAPVVFHWTKSGPLPRRHQVRVLDAMRVLWTSAIINDAPVTYAGPELTAGRGYAFEVTTLDSQENSSVATGSFTPLAPGALTAIVLSLTPVVGVAAGGTTVDVIGLNFQPGARVLFGENEATGVLVIDPGHIRCQTPPHLAGPANVLVINPPSRVGLLERGFTFQ